MLRTTIKTLGTLAVVSLAAGVAQAAPLTNVQGTATFTDTGPSNNNLSFTGVFSPNPLNMNLSTTGPASKTYDPYLTIQSNDTNGFGTATDNLMVAFNFTQPDPATGGITGTGSEEVEFGGFFSNGSITWNNGGMNTVTFSDGAVLQIALSNADFSNFGRNDSADIKGTFTLTHDPSVPEPGALALLGVGLLGLGVVGRRKAS